MSVGRVPKQSVSSSIGIKIKPLEGFDISGQTDFLPGLVHPTGGSITSSDVELFLGDLYAYLDVLRKQEKSIIELIERVKHRAGGTVF